VIDAFSRIIRLGEGVSRSGRISEAAIERAVEALAVCRDKMRSRGVTRARLIATEACRAAENGAEFRARIAEKVGLDLEVIDRQTEATLAATGCTPLMDPYADGVILFDIGGGSSELVRLDRSPQCRRGPPLPKIRGWISLPLGVVTLTERHGGHVVTPEIYAAMIAEVTTFVSPFVAEHGGLGSGHYAFWARRGRDPQLRACTSSAPLRGGGEVDGCWMGNDDATRVVGDCLP
jgi:exopolyphosphatase/guanosine-5'-triphosphate,3'-diphosphate pyrophosphatase